MSINLKAPEEKDKDGNIRYDWMYYPVGGASGGQLETPVDGGILTYKLHISLDDEDYLTRTRDIVVNFLVKNNIAFKCVGNKRGDYDRHVKNKNSSQYGKNFTLYPASVEDFLKVAKGMRKLAPKYKLKGISDFEYGKHNMGYEIPVPGTQNTLYYTIERSTLSLMKRFAKEETDKGDLIFVTDGGAMTKFPKDAFVKPPAKSKLYYLTSPGIGARSNYFTALDYEVRLALMAVHWGEGPIDFLWSPKNAESDSKLKVPPNLRSRTPSYTFNVDNDLLALDLDLRKNPPGVVPIFGGMPTGVTSNKGAVFSEVMIGRNVVVDVGEIGQTIYRGLVGGRTSLAEKRMAMALAVMQTELSDRAKELGANAVANLKLDYEQPNSMNLSLVATGDAVKLTKASLAKIKKNPAGDYHKHEKKVISILKKEGGAAGLEALRPAFPKGTRKASARTMLKKMNHVVLHREGDYILIQGINNPMDYPTLGRDELLEMIDRKWVPTDGKPVFLPPEGYFEIGLDVPQNLEDVGKLATKIANETGKTVYVTKITGPEKDYTTGYYKSAYRITTADLQKANEATNIRGPHKGSPDLHAFEPSRQARKKSSSKQKKNPQLPTCSYRKSKRAKACGGKLRVKKNPKGRVICTDCGAEYEMR